MSRLLASTATLATVATLALLGIAAPRANAQVVYDNGSIIGTTDGWDISDYATADDFLLASPLTFNAIRFYAADRSSGLLNNFSGTISWFIHADNGGAVPGGIPSSTILASGSSSGVTVTDTGTIIAGFHVGQLDFALSSVVTLPAGRYWLRLKEGLPSDAFDGSSIYWTQTGGAITGNGYREDANEVTPTAWNDVGVTTTVDLAYQLRATGAAAPEPGSLALLALALLPAVGILRRKHIMARDRHSSRRFGFRPAAPCLAACALIGSAARMAQAQVFIDSSQTKHLFKNVLDCMYHATDQNSHDFGGATGGFRKGSGLRFHAQFSASLSGNPA